MSKTSRHYYTADDLRDAVEDEQAKFIVWRHQVLRELRACLGQDTAAAIPDGTPRSFTDIRPPFPPCQGASICLGQALAFTCFRRDCGLLLRLDDGHNSS